MDRFIWLIPLGHSPYLWEFGIETQDNNWRQSMWNYCFLASSLALLLLSWFSYPAQAHLLRDIANSVGEPSIKINSLSDTVTRYSDIGTPSVHVPSDDYRLCHVDSWGQLGKRDKNIQKGFKDPKPMYQSYQPLKQQKHKYEDSNNWKTQICQEMGRSKPLRSRRES